MKKTRINEGVLRMRFEDIYEKYDNGILTTQEAGELLGISVSTFYRKREQYKEEVFLGFFDKRLGRRAHNRAADKEVEPIT